MRREFPPKIRLAAWGRCGGCCERCGIKIIKGVQYDHSTPDNVGGEPTLSNCTVLCSPCHSFKTSKIDVPAIAKTKRILAKRIKADRPKSRPMPGTRASGLRKRMDGRVERR